MAPAHNSGRASALPAFLIDPAQITDHQREKLRKRLAGEAMQ